MDAKYLAVEDIMAIHYELVEEFSTSDNPIFPPGPRDMNLVHSAVTRPKTSLGTTEKYNSIYSKASAIFHSLAKNHAFHNGNKRTALVSLLVYLDRHKIRFEASDDELFDFVIAVADDKFGPKGNAKNADQIVSSISDWVEEHTKKGNKRPREMKVSEFLKKCQMAGCRVRAQGKGGSWLVLGPNNGSVKISKSTNQLTGAVVRRYLQDIGIAAVQMGISVDEFQEGVKPEQAQIVRFRNVLNRLAHA